MAIGIRRVDVDELLTKPGQFMAQRVEVTGILESEGPSRTNPRLILRDAENRAIPVTPWRTARGEYSLAKTGTVPQDTVSDCLGHDVILCGTWSERDGRYILCVEFAHVYCPDEDTEVEHNAPIYDGSLFRSAINGEILRALILNPENIAADAPSVVVVIEPLLQTVFLGMLGGFYVGSSRSDFHGFYAQTPLEKPTDVDLEAIYFDEEGDAHSTVTGESLLLLANEGPEKPHPDALYSRFLYDDAIDIIYKVDTGGIAGFNNRIDYVIQVAQLDPED